MYLAVKHFHMLVALLSLCGFVLRGIWMIIDSPMLQRKLVRVLPHINDTALLISALVLAFTIGQYPFVNGWLTAKVIALVAYIGLGVIALKPGRPKPVRIIAFIAALMVFAYIFAVARSHSPWPF